LGGIVTAKLKLREMIYWAAIGIGAITLAAGILAAFRGGGIEPIFITAVFALGAWLVGRAARDVLRRKGEG
jgi:hypothetical protein